MSARARSVGLVALVAVAGLALAVALAILTSTLTTQHVGLAGESARPQSGLVAPRPTAPHTTQTQTQPTDSEHERGDD